MGVFSSLYLIFLFFHLIVLLLCIVGNLKFIHSFPRPNWVYNDIKQFYDNPKDYSTPSGHTMIIITLNQNLINKLRIFNFTHIYD